MMAGEDGAKIPVAINQCAYFSFQGQHLGSQEFSSMIFDNIDNFSNFMKSRSILICDDA